MADISKTDLWIDRDSGQVVSAQPAKGTLLVRKGARITDAVRARIDAAPAPVVVEVAVAPDVETAADTSRPSRKTSK